MNPQFAWCVFCGSHVVTGEAACLGSAGANGASIINYVQAMSIWRYTFHKGIVQIHAYNLSWLHEFMMVKFVWLTEVGAGSPACSPSCRRLRVTWLACAELGRDELNLAPREKCSDLTCLALTYWHSLFWISLGHMRDPNLICARADAVVIN